MEKLQVTMLASGSKGNAALINSGSQLFLVDLGISCRSLTAKMTSLGYSPKDLSGVFITHEHRDHIKGLGTFVKKYQVPLYTSRATWQAIVATSSLPVTKNCYVLDQGLRLGDVVIKAFAIPHDAVDPHGYIFQRDQEKLTYVTDTGFVSPLVREAVTGATTLVLEANHDVKMLKEGSYPPHLKRRILSTKGHLSNDGAAMLLSALPRLPEKVVLAHLSEENNLPSLAHRTVEEILTEQHRLQETELFVASQVNIVSTVAEEDNSQEAAAAAKIENIPLF